MSQDWPRVSTILRDMGLSKPYPEGIPALDHARARGSAVHKAIELYEAGTLDQGALHPEIAGYFRGYLAFREREGFVPTDVELPVYHQKLRYRGTLDARGTLAKDDEARVVVDFKCSKQPDIVACTYQLAAYDMASDGGIADRRLCVGLGEDSYRIWDCWNLAADDIFEAAVRVWWAQREPLK